MDDWDESDRAKVNIIAGQAGITAGAGVVSTNTPRVTLASDDPAVVSLAAIDNIVETNRAAVNPISGQTGVAAGAGAVGATVQRMTLASDDPAVASLSVLDDWDESDRCKTNPIVGQAGIAGGTGTRGATTTRVTIATDDEIVTRSAPPSTGTISSVNDAATSTTILASNSSRKGATFYNDSTSVLYLALSNTTASTSVYSVQIPASGYYELPVSQGGVYTGIVVGIWSADASGAVRVTELT